MSEFREFTKISLHNHFGGRNADNTHDLPFPHAASFDSRAAYAKIDNAATNGFELIGFTNHNCFQKDKFQDLLSYIRGKNYDISLLPGTELDIVESTTSPIKFLHTVVLVNPKSKLEDFEAKLENVFNLNGHYYATIEQLADIVLPFKAIIIPHGAKQKNRSISANKTTFEDMIGLRKAIPVMIEDTRKSKGEILRQKLRSHLNDEDYEWITEDAASVSSSDQADDFSEIAEPTYIWGENSFDALFYAAIMGDKRVFRQADIVNKQTFISRLEITKVDSKAALQTGVIEFSHGLNSIIGNSGSGKTLLLNLIMYKLKGSNLRNAISSTKSDYHLLYEGSDIKLFDKDGKEIKPNSVNVFEGESLYRQIVDAISGNQDKLLESMKCQPSFDETVKVIQSFNQRLKKYIDTSVKCAEEIKALSEKCASLNASIATLNANTGFIESLIEFTVDPKQLTKKREISSKVVECGDDGRKADEAGEAMLELLNKYGLTKEAVAFFELQKSLREKIERQRKGLIRKLLSLSKEQERDAELSRIVSKWNEKLGEKAKVVAEAKQNLQNKKEEIIASLKYIYEKKQSLDIPTLKNENLSRSVQCPPGVARISNVSAKTEFEYDVLPDFFPGVIGSGKSAINKSEFKNKLPLNKLDITDESSVEAFANVFVDASKSFESFLHFAPDNGLITYNIELRDAEGNYKPIQNFSAGQLSKVYINVLLEKGLSNCKNNAIILYDQPDNNLEKAFVYNELARKLNELKRTYQIIVTTHEPLLVVNADSNHIIRAQNDPINGEPSICYENIGMYDVDGRQGAVDKIAKLIDGDVKALGVRYQVYGGDIL